MQILNLTELEINRVDIRVGLSGALYFMDGSLQAVRPLRNLVSQVFFGTANFLRVCFCNFPVDAYFPFDFAICFTLLALVDVYLWHIDALKKNCFVGICLYLHLHMHMHTYYNICYIYIYVPLHKLVLSTSSFIFRC